MKKLITLIIIIFYIYPVCALTLTGTDARGNVYTSDSAQGSIVEKQVLSSDNASSSNIFSWGCSITNATNALDLSVSDFDVSEAGNIYVLTLGPDITDPIPNAVSVPVELPPAESVAESSLAVPSSGGGGGGGSSRRDTYGLIIGDTVTVMINNEQHTITITNILKNSAVLTIDEKYVIELNVQEEKQIDVNNDGINEISITLDDVTELKKITITVYDLTLESEKEIIEETENPPPLERITSAVSAVDVQKIEDVSHEISKTTSTIITYVVGLNMAVGILLGGIYSVKRVKQKKIYTAFHIKSKDDIIKQELAKVRSYVSAAMENGKTVSSIKQKLVEQGWQEYEIDSVMVDAMLKEEEGLNRIL